MSKSKKKQGTTAKTGEMSDHKVQMSPDKSKGRGIGSEFAYAVKDMISQVSEIKKNESNFLGTPKESIDIQQFVQSLSGK